MINTVMAFSIPIAIGNLENKQLNSLLLNDINNHNNYRKGTGVNINQTEFGLEKEYESFKELQLLIEEQLKIYMSWVGVNCNYYSYNYWANINNTSYGYNMVHVHSFKRGLFSGIYFPLSIKPFENDHSHINIEERPSPGSLVFIDPLQSVKMGLSYSNLIDRNRFFGSPLTIQPRESYFVFFPNYLQHMVTPTEKENKIRISIAFDIQLMEQ